MHDTTALPLLAAARGDHAPGLVWAIRGGPDEETRELPAEGIAEALARDDGWLWLHIDLIDQRSRAWIGTRCALPEAARALIEGSHTALSLSYDDGMVHGVGIDFQRELDDTDDTVGRYVFAVSERLLVTGRQHPLEALAAIRNAMTSQRRFTSGYEIFGAIMVTFCRNASARFTAAADVLDEVEDNLMSERAGDDRRKLRQVRRLAAMVHRPVSALVSLFNDDDREEWGLPSGADKVLNKLTSLLEMLDREALIVSDRARLLQEEISAELAEATNRSLNALTIMSALLLPGTLVVGVFGMNTGGLPFSASPYGFLGAMLVAVAGTITFYGIMQRIGARLRLRR